MNGSGGHRIVAGWVAGAAATLLLASPARAWDEDIRILRSDARSILIEFRPAYHPVRVLETPSGPFSLYDFTGGVPPRGRSAAGLPDLRHRSIPLAFPAREGNVVRVVAADYEDVPGATVAPVPVYRVREEFVEPESLRTDRDAYASSSFAPEPLASLGPVEFTRSMILGSLRVWPVQFNAAGRVVRRHSRIVVEIEYGPPLANRAPTADAAILAGSVLNGSVARSWTFTTPRPLARAVPSVLATGDWYRLTVNDEGIYRLDAQFFANAGIPIGSVDPRTLRLFGNGGAELSENPQAPRPADLVEIAVHVEGEGDGRFDQNDALIFYGKSVRNWVYDASRRTRRHTINHYTESNRYWLTFGGAQGRRMAARPPLAAPATVTPDRFRDAALVEEERVNLVRSGKHWYSQAIPGNSSFTYVNVLQNLIPNERVDYRYSLVARSDVTPVFTIREGSTVLGEHYFASRFTTGGEFEGSGTSTLPDNTSRVQFEFSSSSAGATGWVDWLEVHYPRSFTVSNNALRFRSPDTTAVVEYQVGTFSAPSFIFDVTEHADVRILAAGATNVTAFRDSVRSGSLREYCAAGPGGYRTPAGVERAANQNLRGFAEGADFIIVTSREYATAAERLRQVREQPAGGGLRTVVADVDQIYNEFGGGLPDITAIRDYLKWAYETWTRRPEYVLFLGAASYDYKGILGSRSSYVPTWQSLESWDDIASYASDDYFTRFDASTRPYLTSGRIPSRSPAEATALVEKIVRYEEQSARDGWVRRMVFVGDDAWNPDNPEFPYWEGTIHSQQAEDLARYYTPNEFDKRKLYLAEYPTVTTAQGRRKPAVFQAIVDEINRGALVVNFTGHGNPAVWAHENVFNVQTSIPLLTNATRYALFYGATCNFSQFDDPKRYTGGELLLNRVEGGAIAVVSAARKVFADRNAYLHQQNFRFMFQRDPYGRLLVDRPARALFLYKSTGANDDNDQKYVFLGDPTMRLQWPTAFASVDSINGERVDSVAGLPRTSPIRLRALERVNLHGTIRDNANRPDTAYTGQTQIIVNDASRIVTIVDFYPGVNWSYLGSGGVIYRGNSSVRNGRFAASFVVPRDISYADSAGQITAYATGGGPQGLGFTDRIAIRGTDSTLSDAAGPQIRLYVGSRGFRPGDLVGGRPRLIVDLSDSSGINTSTAGIGHRIEAWLNAGSQSVDLTDAYQSALDDFRSGSAEIELAALPPGRNTVRVRAWDTFNNSSTAETHFEVTASDELTIADVMNYPNPVGRQGTSFTFRQNQLTPLSITVRIYTVAGRVIRTLDAAAAGEPFVRIPWDGRDADGDEIANGVYLYKLVVRTADGRYSSEALGKLAMAK